jgi:AraC-like DNA-binding protein
MEQNFFTSSPARGGNATAVEGMKLVRVEGAAMAYVNTIGNDHLAELLQRPYRMDAVVLVVCTKGEVRLTSQSSEYVVPSGKMLFVSASVTEFESVVDSELYLLVFGHDFLTSMNINATFLVNMMTVLRHGAHVVDISLSSEALTMMFEDLYMSHEKSQGNLYAELSLRHLFCSIIYKMYGVVADKSEKVLGDVGVKDRSGEYFERLLKLLSENFREHRTVEFYAEKMNVSSKHLSRVVRSLTDKSVHQWIDEFVVLEIKNMLRYSDMSIQQISYSLNFPNPSFMGQYFKRITGMTPGDYKKEKIGGKR